MCTFTLEFSEAYNYGFFGVIDYMRGALGINVSSE